MNNTVALIGKLEAADASRPLEALALFLTQGGHTVVIEAETAAKAGPTGYPTLDIPALGAAADVAIVLGGDGTVLGIARRLAPYRVPLIGVNLGRLGFMTDIAVEQMMPVIDEMLAGKVETEERALLQGSAYRGDEMLLSSLAFNDVVVARCAGSGMVELRVIVDRHFMCNQRSDGLIVATPTGSTAYALSAGGPILHPSLKGIVLTPIAPHSLSNRPIVVPEDSMIEIEIMGDHEVGINFDMQAFINLQLGDRIVLQRALDSVIFMHPQGWSYYDTLRRKLRWNEGPSVAGMSRG